VPQLQRLECERQLGRMASLQAQRPLRPPGALLGHHALLLDHDHALATAGDRSDRSTFTQISTQAITDPGVRLNVYIPMAGEGGSTAVRE
jgi:hypothetical protein